MESQQRQEQRQQLEDQQRQRWRQQQQKQHRQQRLPAQQWPTVQQSVRAQRQGVAKSASSAVLDEAGTWVEVVRGNRRGNKQNGVNLPQQSAQRQPAHRQHQQWPHQRNGQQQQRMDIHQQEKRRPRRKRPDEIVVVPVPGVCYKDMYVKIRTSPRIADFQRQIGVGRRTPKDHLLLPLSRDVESATLKDIIQEVIGESGSVTIRTEMAEVVLTGIDNMIDEEAIKKAVMTTLGKQSLVATVNLWERQDMTKRARVRLPRAEAELVKDRRLELGYTYSAIDEEEQIAAASDLLQVRTALDSAITTSKKEHFDEMLRGLAEDETGQWFRNVFSRLRGSWTARERDSSVLECIVSTLFPQHPSVDWPASQGQVLERGEEEPVWDVTEQELLDIASSLNTRKAPRLDGVPHAALMAAIRKHTDIFRKLFQECLDNERFPDDWKKQKLALIPKPDKPPGLASSFRPILLLNNPSKVYERLLLSRINDVVEDPESLRLAENQYGFRRGRSTVQAIQLVVDAGRHAMSFGRTNNRDKRCLLVVALDVRNAFNTASWQCIATALEDKGVPRQLRNILRDYFANRELVYDTADGPVTRRVTAGVPQGSILGPTQWNIIYDGVLRVELPEGASVIGYADDIVVMARGCTPEEVALVAEQAVDAIAAWMEDHHLQLAPENTEGVMISSLRRGQLRVPLRVGDTIIHSKQSIRYLGVQIHDHLSWKPHVELSTAKALRVVGAVTAVMRNHSGPQVA
ncbi:uncharacterized protein LOC133391529 [Anopheles gambiae]|uniref:uncharacterized protein LOC133391529 n=1 Tax=Anopheles gambiae TaxID=7165 RepID=UPI002AC9D2C5|nr:uncharacterized protein LOC133391529 [Anopheles gambiae]